MATKNTIILAAGKGTERSQNFIRRCTAYAAKQWLITF